MKRKRSWGLWIVAAAIAGAVAWGFRPQPILVDTAQVSRGRLAVSVEEEGKTRVVDRFVISAPTAGYVRRVEFKVGNTVRRGQTLLRLDPLRAAVLDPRARAEAKARVSTARAAVAVAEDSAEAAAADASYWENQLARLKKLLEAGLTPEEEVRRAEAEFDRTQASLSSARAQVDVARLEVKTAQTILDHSAVSPGEPAETVTVRAPVSGAILKIVRESEGVVQPGESVVEIGNPRGLEIEVEALSADAVRIAVGGRVLLERWGGERPLEARVRTIEPTGFTKISALGVEEQRVLIISDIVSPPEEWEKLGDGYRVEASFILWEENDVLQIPSSALFRQGEGWTAFVVEEGIAQRREIEVGRRNGLAAQALSGVSEGDVVILHPDDAVEDGVEIIRRNGSRVHE